MWLYLDTYHAKSPHPVSPPTPGCEKSSLPKGPPAPERLASTLLPASGWKPGNSAVTLVCFTGEMRGRLTPCPRERPNLRRGYQYNHTRARTSVQHQFNVLAPTSVFTVGAQIGLLPWDLDLGRNQGRSTPAHLRFNLCSHRGPSVRTPKVEAPKPISHYRLLLKGSLPGRFHSLLKGGPDLAQGSGYRVSTNLTSWHRRWNYRAAPQPPNHKVSGAGFPLALPHVCSRQPSGAD